jgi:hypothetical protein
VGYARDAGLHTVTQDHYVFACDGNGTVHDRGDCVVDVFAGTAALFNDKGINTGDSELDWRSLHSLLEATAQIYNAVELRADTVRLESDLLGLKPIYKAEIESGVVLTTSLRDLIAAFPEAMQGGDALGIAEFLMFGMPLFERTLHRNIERIPVGACLEWRNGKLTVSHERRFHPPRVEGDLSVSEATRYIHDTTLATLNRRIGHASRPVSLGLSGGFDSRFVAALASEAKVPIRAYSYGEAYHNEIYCARAVAECLNVQQTMLPYDADSIFNGLPVYLRHVEGQADLMMVQITNLLQIPEPAGAALLHGYLGDALSGAHLEWLISPHPKTADEIASDVVLHRGGKSAIGGVPVPEFMGLGIHYQDIMHHIAANLPVDGEAHQNLILFDCENRQRRSVGSQMALLGTRFHVIVPNYDVNVFAGYFRLPRLALDDRYILRRVFARYWPHLANIPHAEEEHPIVPRLRVMVPFAVREYKHVLGRRILGAQRYDSLQRRWRDPYPWRMSYGVSNSSQVARVIDGITVSMPVLDRLFGVRMREQDVRRTMPSPGYVVEPHCARRLFAMGEYGKWLESQMQHLVTKPSGHTPTIHAH